MSFSTNSSLQSSWVWNFLSFVARAIIRLYIPIVRLVPALGKYFDVIRLNDEIADKLDLDNPEVSRETSTKQCAVMQGWLIVNTLNIKKYSDMIRMFFTPIPTYYNKIKDFIRKNRVDCDILIGVHIRQGDYEYFKGGRYYLTVGQYLEVMTNVEKLFPQKSIKFLICSDEKLYPGSFKRFAFSFGIGGVVEDLYSLAHCDYLIGVPSTYSRWASFFGQVPLYQILDPAIPPTLQDFRIDLVEPHFLETGEVKILN